MIFLWLSFENDCQNRHAKQSTSTSTTTHNAYYNISKETTASSVFYLSIQWGSVRLELKLSDMGIVGGLELSKAQKLAR